MKIWSKQGEDSSDKINKFTAEEDILLDQNLIFWDALGSIAQAKMLNKIEILTDEETAQVIAGLKEIIELDKQNKFQLKEELEDVHTNIEFFLTEKYGDVGKKIHTGRSRNDQIALDLALYEKHKLLKVMEFGFKLCSSLEKIAEKNNIPMTGYTHLQKAMPTTFAQWALYHYEQVLTSLSLMFSVYGVINKNPLGAGAAYGSVFPIDVEYTTKLLGFDDFYKNSISAVSSRGKNEFLILNSLLSVMIDLSKIAEDLLLFSTKEFGYVTFSDKFTTGSSIMPQKKNADILELIKGKTAKLFGFNTQAAMTIKCSPLGYNRDVQEIKYPLMDGFETVIFSLDILSDMIDNTKVNKEKLLQSLTIEVFATDISSYLVKKGTPFRDAYKIVGNAMNSENPKEKLKEHLTEEEICEVTDFYKNIAMKTHIGAPGDLNMSQNIKTIKIELKNKYLGEKNKFEQAINALLE